MPLLLSDLSDVLTIGRTAESAYRTRLSDLPDLSDRKVEGGGKNSIRLSALAARWRADLDHDEAEAWAMAEHHETPASPDLPTPDPLTVGLLRGFHAHRRRG